MAHTKITRVDTCNFPPFEELITGRQTDRRVDDEVTLPIIVCGKASSRLTLLEHSFLSFLFSDRRRCFGRFDDVTASSKTR